MTRRACPILSLEPCSLRGAACIEEEIGLTLGILEKIVNLVKSGWENTFGNHAGYNSCLDMYRDFQELPCLYTGSRFQGSSSYYKGFHPVPNDNVAERRSRLFYNNPLPVRSPHSPQKTSSKRRSTQLINIEKLLNFFSCLLLFE